MDRFKRMVALLRSGQTAEPDQLRAEEPGALLPPWTAGEPLSPALRQVHQLESSIRAVRLDDTYAWALADGSISYRISPPAVSRTGCAWRARTHSYYPDVVFDGDRVVAVEDERLLVWDLATGKLLLATDPDDIPRARGPCAASRSVPESR